MSYAITDHVRKLKIGNPTAKAVLLRLADYANDNGECFPSISLLAEDTEFSVRAIKNAIDLLEEVNNSIDKWRKENNITDGELTPKSVVYDAYHGDLIICLKNLLIPLEQAWFLGVDSHYFNYETEEVLTVPFQFQMPMMSFEEFRFGSTTVKMPRGSGIYTRWKGINDELNELLDAKVPQGFERIRSDALMRVTTKFNNVADYIYFKEAKVAREMLKVAI